MRSWRRVINYGDGCHEEIAKIPSKMMYGGKLQTTDDRQTTFEQDFPGMQATQKIETGYSTVLTRATSMTEEDLRCHSLSVPGDELTNDKTSSKVNLQGAKLT